MPNGLGLQFWDYFIGFIKPGKLNQSQLLYLKLFQIVFDPRSGRHTQFIGVHGNDSKLSVSCAKLIGHMFILNGTHLKRLTIYRSHEHRHN